MRAFLYGATALLLAGGADAQIAPAAAVAPVPPRPPRVREVSIARAPRAWGGGHRMFSAWTRGNSAPLLDSAKAASFFAALSQTPVALCEMAVDNLGNGWGWASGSAYSGALRDQSQAARNERATYGQAQMAESAIPVVAASLAKSDACSRRAAARLLGQSELVSASRALRDAARHSDGRVREAALLGIGIREDSANYPAAVQGISDRDPEVVRMAAWALGEYERPASVSLLIPLLKRPEEGVRAAAASALGDIEDESAIDPLIARLNDSSDRVRFAVIFALANLEAPAAVPGLAALLKDESVEIRVAAVDALSQIESPTVTNHLVLAMKDRDAEVRKRAAEALGDR